MTRTQLVAAINLLWIRPGAYALDGSGPGECYALVHEGHRWAVFYSERGQRNGLRCFATEAEANAHLLVLLARDQSTWQ